MNCQFSPSNWLAFSGRLQIPVEMKTFFPGLGLAFLGNNPFQLLTYHPFVLLSHFDIYMFKTPGAYFWYGYEDVDLITGSMTANESLFPKFSCLFFQINI